VRKRPLKLFLLVMLLISTGFLKASGQRLSAAVPRQRPHMDHVPKHGGVFFMSLDNRHHLEAVLLSPGIFRVYLYDAYTRPLTAEKVKQAKGTVQLGDSEDAPKIPLTLAKDGQTLEVALPRGTKLPLSITLLLHLPGTKSGDKAEVFNFHFSHYVGANAPAQHPGSMNHSDHEAPMDHGKR
jgi:hypothetical protein